MYFTNRKYTIAENIKLFMYKYNFTYHDWLGPLHVFLKKIECYFINKLVNLYNLQFFANR